MYELGLYEKAMPSSLSLREKLTAARSAGFDFVELSVDESEEKLTRVDWTRQERREVVNTMLDCGMKFGSICLSGQRKLPMGSHDPVIRAQSVELLRKTIRLASDLGIRLIQLAGYDVYYEEGDRDTRRWFAENLSQCVATAAAEGVTLGFETMETPFMDTTAKAMYYVNLMNSPYLQVYPDIGNLTNAAVKYGHSWELDLASGAGSLVAMHLKETVPGRYREVPYGMGHVDFNKAVSLALKLGVRRFTGEFWYCGESDWEELLAQSAKYLRIAFEANALDANDLRFCDWSRV